LNLPARVASWSLVLIAMTLKSVAAAEIVRPDVEVAGAKGVCQLLDVVSPALD
jgi:hypothetical protein